LLNHIDMARQHVIDAKEMKRYAREKIQEAKDNYNDPFLTWEERIDCWVADYCQNMGVPSTEDTQPGATYYWTPLAIYCFGIVNTGVPVERLRAYIYHKGEGEKGGDNVASLFWQHLIDSGVYDPAKGPRAELTIIMDNCSGQNKNNYVLRFIAMLVELGVYKKARAVFLVAGHTKNVADRLFNSLKYVYRHANLYTMKQVVDCLNASTFVDAVHVAPSVFRSHRKLQKII